MLTSNEQNDSTALARRESATLRRIFFADWIVCVAALLLFGLAEAIFFFGSGFGSHLDSDAAVPVLLADEILRKGSVLPSSWYYVNGEIWLLSPQLFALPFVAALGASPLALKLGNIVATVLMVGSMMLPIQRVSRSWPFSITIALGVLAVFSRQHVNVIYEQAAYGWICAKLALFIFLSLRMLSGPYNDSTLLRRLTSWNAGFYLFLLIELTTSNPLRALVYWCIPFTIVCILQPPSWPPVRRTFLIALTGSAFLIGTLLHLVLSRYLTVVPGVGALQPVANWPAHLHLVWMELPMLLQYQLTWPAPALDPVFAATLMRCIFFAGAAATMILIWRRSPDGCAERQFFARLAGTMFAVVFVAVIVAISATTLRYLVPPALICLAAFMTTLRFWLTTYPAIRVTVAAIFVIAFCGGGVFLVATFPSDGSPADCEAPIGICRLRAGLQQQGLHKGYATYWNANVTTLASRGDISVCGVLLEPRLLPFRWLVSKDCFESPQQSDRYFIALVRSQITQVDRQNVLAEAGPPDSTANAGDYELWIYEAGNHRLDWLRR